MIAACSQLGSGTCANAKKNIGDKKNEKGILKSLIVELLTISQSYLTPNSQLPTPNSIQAAGFLNLKP